MIVVNFRNLIRDLVLNANEKNIDTIMDIITLLSDIGEYNYSDLKFSFTYTDKFIELDINTNTDSYIYQFLYNDRIFYYYNTDSGLKSEEINYDECKNLIKGLIKQDDILLDSKYEVGVLN